MKRRGGLLVIERKLGSDPWEPIGGWVAGVPITPELLAYLKGIYKRVRVTEYVSVREYMPVRRTR